MGLYLIPNLTKNTFSVFYNCFVHFFLQKNHELKKIQAGRIELVTV
jgi:hypothetical protein